MKKEIYVQTNYGRHLCILEPDEKIGYIVTTPGLAGVITWGRNISHAKKMAKEAIELCIECLVEKMIAKRTTKLSRELSSTTR